jgi:hypothetical protein
VTRRLGIFLAIAVLTVIASAAPAEGDGASGTASDGGSSVSVGASSSSSSPGSLRNHPSGGGSEGSTSPCRYIPLPAQDAETFGPGGPMPGGWFFVVCTGKRLTIFTGVLTWIPSVSVPIASPAVVAAHTLALQARDSLTLPSPEIGLNPAPFSVVDFATWLWIAPAVWHSFRATATAGGVTATATAVPQAVDWSTGDGHHVVCDGPGVTYQPAIPASDQVTNCSYTYPESSAGQPTGNGDSNSAAFTLVATVEWAVTWSATGAPGGGVLPPLFTSSAVRVRVEQVESVGTDG